MQQQGNAMLRMTKDVHTRQHTVGAGTGHATKDGSMKQSPQSEARQTLREITNSSKQERNENGCTVPVEAKPWCKLSGQPDVLLGEPGGYRAHSLFTGQLLGGMQAHDPCAFSHGAQHTNPTCSTAGEPHSSATAQPCHNTSQ